MQLDTISLIIGAIAGAILAAVVLLVEVIAVSKTEKYAKKFNNPKP